MLCVCEHENWGVRAIIEVRDPTGFILALWLRHAGKVEDEVRGLVVDWNSRLSRPLPASNISRLVRNAFKPQYIKPPSCKHPLMKASCVGEDCPVFKVGGLWQEAPVTPSGAMASGLFAVLQPREWKGFCALCEFAKRKGAQSQTFRHVSRHPCSDRCSYLFDRDPHYIHRPPPGGLQGRLCRERQRYHRVTQRSLWRPLPQQRGQAHNRTPVGSRTGARDTASLSNNHRA
jgi:hypothetical protein